MTKNFFTFDENLQLTIQALKTKNFDTALKHIDNAIVENPHAPEVHNLLGILEELKGDLTLAGKHYRAAYALDPTYTAAVKNLDRITLNNRTPEKIEPDYGNKPEKEEVPPYTVEYDSKHVGHLVKRTKKVKDNIMLDK